MKVSTGFKCFFSIILLVGAIFVSFSRDLYAFSGSESYEGQVIEILEYQDTDNDGKEDIQLLKVEIFKEEANKEVEVKNPITHDVRSNEYKVGERVQIEVSQSEDETSYYIVGYVRKIPILILCIIFVVLALLVGQIKGLTSLLSLALTFVVIFFYTLPRIYEGSSPVLVSIVTLLFAIPITFYVAHGFTKKTTISVMGSFISVIVTIVFAQVAVNATKLTGLGTDESTILNVISDKNFDMRGLLLAGMLISSVGVLDDVTISQAGVVKKLKELNPKFKFRDLFMQSMEIGHDHIASMINTLVLVYAGASLPLLLIFVESSRDVVDIINQEFIAEEIVRTLVGSVGLIIAVPVTSLIASLAYEESKEGKT